MTYELAEVNIGRLAAGLDTPQLEDFVGSLECLNALADAADGFRWRLQTEDGDATSVVAFADDVADGVGVITNLSTWRDVESLAAFTYGPMHAEIMRRRREWFLPIREAYLACWWVPARHRPSTAEAEERVRRLRADGPSPSVFTLRRSFPPPSTLGAEVPTDRDDWLCPV